MSLELSVSNANVSFTAATALIEAALRIAEGMSVPIAIGVVDGGGTLKAFGRADNAPFLTVDIANNKAWTAVYGYPTHIWNDYISDPKVAPLGYHPRMMAVGGGYPLRKNGVTLGGIGISGGNYAQDQEIAEAAMKEFGFDIL